MENQGTEKEKRAETGEKKLFKLKYICYNKKRVFGLQDRIRKGGTFLDSIRQTD